MRPFTHDVEEDLPFDDDDDWDLDRADEEQDEAGSDELPEDEWRAGPHEKDEE